jgi:SecD/SecF fusion protein
MADRRRNALILLIVAGLLILSALVIATQKTRLGLDLKGGVQLVYEGKPTAQAKVDDESLSRAIDIMRKRVDKLGVAQPEIQRSGGSEIVVGLPDVSNAARAEKEVGKTAQLYFYDWEPNVIGPDGKPAPTEGTITGDATRTGAGGATAGLPKYQAVLRAAKLPTTTRPGSAAARRSRPRDASTAAGTCSTPSTKRCCAVPRKRNATSPPTTSRPPAPSPRRCA